jgi:PIN domain nuclease of toxin-antitoxin system
MSASYVVDSHALLWFLAGSPALAESAKRIMADEANRLVLPAISLAEICRLIEKNRTTITLEEISAAVTQHPRLTVAPLDGQIVFTAHKYTALDEMHDKMIVATAAIHIEQHGAIALISADQAIRNAAIVPVLWSNK